MHERRTAHKDNQHGGRAVDAGSIKHNRMKVTGYGWGPQKIRVDNES